MVKNNPDEPKEWPTSPLEMPYQLDIKACTLLEYMQHEVQLEYEKAKKSICEDNKELKPRKLNPED